MLSWATPLVGWHLLRMYVPGATWLVDCLLRSCSLSKRVRPTVGTLRRHLHRPPCGPPAGAAAAGGGGAAGVEGGGALPLPGGQPRLPAAGAHQQPDALVPPAGATGHCAAPDAGARKQVLEHAALLQPALLCMPSTPCSAVYWLPGPLESVQPRAGFWAAVRRWLLRRWSPDLEGHAEETALQLVLNPSCIQNSLYMARCEFETLAAPPDWWLLRQLGPRFAALCSPDDMWFPRYKWEAMLQVMPSSMQCQAC